MRAKEGREKGRGGVEGRWRGGASNGSWGKKWTGVVVIESVREKWGGGIEERVREREKEERKRKASRVPEISACIAVRSPDLHWFRVGHVTRRKTQVLRNQRLTAQPRHHDHRHHHHRHPDRAPPRLQHQPQLYYPTAPLEWESWANLEVERIL